MMVYSELDIIDQVCLALTCKRLIQVAYKLEVPLQVPSVKKHRPNYTRLCGSMFKLLYRLMPIDNLTRLPRKSMTLCERCLRYRHTMCRGEYWLWRRFNDPMDRRYFYYSYITENNRDMRASNDEWRRRLELLSHDLPSVCPECHYHWFIDMVDWQVGEGPRPTVWLPSQIRFTCGALVRT